MGDHFLDARRDDCSGMPPAINQARTDLMSGVSSKLLAAFLLQPQSPQKGQGLDSHDAELDVLVPTSSAQKSLGMHAMMDDLPSSGDVGRLPLESSSRGGRNLLEDSDHALNSAQSPITSAPMDHALGMHANKGQVSESCRRC